MADWAAEHPAGGAEGEDLQCCQLSCTNSFNHSAEELWKQRNSHRAAAACPRGSSQLHEPSPCPGPVVSDPPPSDPPEDPGSGQCWETSPAFLGPGELVRFQLGGVCNTQQPQAHRLKLGFIS